MKIITGTGRSGTGLLAAVLKDCGLPITGGWNPAVRSGLEDPEIVRLNQKIARQFGITHPDLGSFEKFPKLEILKKSAALFGAELRAAAERVSVVKDPRFCLTLPVWILAGVPVDFVLVSLRRIGPTVKSRLDIEDYKIRDPNWWQKHLLAELGLLFHSLFFFSVPFQVVLFPDDYQRKDGGERWRAVAAAFDLDFSVLIGAVEKRFSSASIVHE